MKTIKLLIVLLMLSASLHAQKVFSKGDITCYGISFGAGMIDGFHQVLWHKIPYSGQWWNPYISWENKEHRGWVGKNVFTFTSDADHAFKFAHRVTLSVAVGLSLDDFRKGESPWRIPKRILGSLLAQQAGMILTHEILY